MISTNLDQSHSTLVINDWFSKSIYEHSCTQIILGGKIYQCRELSTKKIVLYYLKWLDKYLFLLCLLFNCFCNSK